MVDTSVQERALDTLTGLTGPETEIIEQLTGKTFGGVAAELTGDPREMPIRTAVAASFVMRRRSEPATEWEQHWNLPVDEAIAWLVPEGNPEG